MIDREQLRDLHGGDLPLHILEQDYVQALVLTELYRETEAVVFKGGTYLKHAHGLDRFSEDLDFTRLGDTDLERAFRNTAGSLDRYGVPAELDRFEPRPAGVEGRIRYAGPLYDGTDRSRGSIAIEISTRDDLVCDPEWDRLFFPYPETRAVTVLCLPIEEAIAEKLRALSTRSRGRDLYDCWFLIEQGIELNPDLFRAKMEAVNAPPAVSIGIDEAEWDRDLSILVRHPPSYQEALDTVTAALERVAIAVEMD